MAAPPIRYTTSADGTKIAYWVLGDGPTAMVQLPYPWSHLRNEWELPEIASWYERLAAGRTLIAYDARGMGLSGPAQSHSLEPAAMNDLEAVLAAAGVQRVAMLAFWHQGFTAIHFAARFPERVSRLVLWGTATRGADLYTKAVAATSGLGIVDRAQYARTTARSFMGWNAGDVVDRYIGAALGGSPLPPGGPVGLAASGHLEEFQALDVTELAGSLQVPTLVLHSRANTIVRQETAATLAAAIPGARLVVLEGESLVLPIEVSDQALVAIESFMREPIESGGGAGVAAAEAGAGTMAGPPYPAGLSGREVEVLRLVSMGASNPEIAERLVISINTVTSHLTHIYGKTGTNNRVEATRYAIERGLTE
ncbi:MAG: alpha/beta fold hydrolase [Dehalococcoidia bacterium]|jgi:DNA-binding CsgD family transcriptional regulator/pimeloyl-ACP methyl ester carboxylesterase|nr:alpha/beta fold hydrolase [Dehalococcoidia bacterium]